MKTFLKTFAVLSVFVFAFLLVSDHRVSGATLTTWLYSQETVKYDTTDGDLHVGQYALQPDGKSYIAFVATSSQQTATTTNSIPAQLTSSSDGSVFSGMILVHDVGRKYIDAFTDGTSVLKAPSSQASYRGLNKKSATTPTYTAPVSPVAFLKDLIAPTKAFAAIAYDTAQSYTACVTGTSCTYSYTVTGSNMLLVCMNMNYGTLPGTTTMSYNGQAMIPVGTQQYNNTGSNNATMDTFYVTGATPGAHNLVISTTNSMTNGFYAHCASYTGVKQTAPIDVSTQHNTTYPNSYSDSLSLTTVTDKDWIVGLWADVAGRAHTAGANTVVRTTDSQGAVADGNAPVTPPGSSTITINTSNTGFLATGIAIKPSIDGPSNLQVESQTNPTSVATSNPRFSALVNTASSTLIASAYQMQFSKSAGNWTSLYSDTGKKTLASSTPANQRTPQIYSTTTFPQDGATYYWRMTLWDQYNNQLNWSESTDFFTMNALPLSYPATTLQDLTYSYDSVGNITSIADRSGNSNTGTTSYQYDNLYRLQGATTTNSSANYVQSYVYDWLGNITNKSDQGAYTYAATGYANPDAVTSIGSQNYTYDNAGNLLTSGNGSATTSYTWDYRNRMTDTLGTLGGATTTHYAYDANDQRVQMDVKKGAAATTSTKYFNQFYEVMGATTTMYIYAGGQLVATIEGNGHSTSTAVVHTDHQGSTAVTSSATGTLLTLNSYYPYGDLRLNQKTTTFDEQRKSLGQFYDDATALNYYNARYMSGSKGQFMSQDPVSRDVAMMGNMTGYILDVNQSAGMFDQTALLGSPQLLNLYSYAGDNPVTKSDPSGLYTLPDMILAGLFYPRTLSADPNFEPAMYQEQQQPTIIFGGDAVPIKGGFIPKGNIVPEGTFFRGGKSFELKPGEARVGENGFVTQKYGPSVNTDPTNPNVVKYGGPNQVLSHAQELQIKPGSNGHANIVPKPGANLTPQQFQQLLNKTQTQPYTNAQSTPAMLPSKKTK